MQAAIACRLLPTREQTLEPPIPPESLLVPRQLYQRRPLNPLPGGGSIACTSSGVFVLILGCSYDLAPVRFKRGATSNSSRNFRNELSGTTYRRAPPATNSQRRLALAERLGSTDSASHCTIPPGHSAPARWRNGRSRASGGAWGLSRRHHLGRQMQRRSAPCSSP